MPGTHPQLGRLTAKPSPVFYLSDWLHVCSTQNREMGLKDLINDCVRKHGQRSGQKQFIIGLWRRRHQWAIHHHVGETSVTWSNCFDAIVHIQLYNCSYNVRVENLWEIESLCTLSNTRYVLDLPERSQCVLSWSVHNPQSQSPTT